MSDDYTVRTEASPTLMLRAPQPNYNVTFYKDGAVLGCLDFNGPEMTFTGTADESAKVFFNFVAESFAQRLKDERRAGMLEAADVVDALRAELAAIKGQTPDAVLHKDGHAPLEVRISEKHDYGCKLPHGTKFYLHPPVADKDAERYRWLTTNTKSGLPEVVIDHGNGDMDYPKKADIDAAIDAAMAKGE